MNCYDNIGTVCELAQEESGYHSRLGELLSDKGYLKKEDFFVRLNQDRTKDYLFPQRLSKGLMPGTSYFTIPKEETEAFEGLLSKVRSTSEVGKGFFYGGSAWVIAATVGYFANPAILTGANIVFGAFLTGIGGIFWNNKAGLRESTYTNLKDRFSPEHSDDAYDPKIITRAALVPE